MVSSSLCGKLYGCGLKASLYALATCHLPSRLCEFDHQVKIIIIIIIIIK
jgi:hypothetical protein